MTSSPEQASSSSTINTLRHGSWFSLVSREVCDIGVNQRVMWKRQQMLHCFLWFGIRNFSRIYLPQCRAKHQRQKLDDFQCCLPLMASLLSLGNLMPKRRGQTGETHGGSSDRCKTNAIKVWRNQRFPLQPLFQLLLNNVSVGWISFYESRWCSEDPKFSGSKLLVQDISSFMTVRHLIWGAFPQSHARSAFCIHWWINCCVWRWGIGRCLSKGTKTALGAGDWRPTIPTTAPSWQLPAGWWSNLDPTSCTPCESGVSASWYGTRSRNHGGMPPK